MGSPVGQVRIDEDQYVGIGHEEGLPERLAFARMNAEVGTHIGHGVHLRPGISGDSAGRIRGE